MVVLLALTLTTAAEAEQRQRGSRPARNTPTPRAEALSRNIPPRLLLPAGSDRFPTDMRRSVFPGGRRPGFHKPGVVPSRRAVSVVLWRVCRRRLLRILRLLPAGVSGPGCAGSGAGGRLTHHRHPEARDHACDRPAVLHRRHVSSGRRRSSAREFEVNAGARRIEIRAPGYKPVIFDARFVPGGTVTRRGALEPLEDVSPLPRAAGSTDDVCDPGLLHGQCAAGTECIAERLRHRPPGHARRLMTCSA